MSQSEHDRESAGDGSAASQGDEVEDRYKRRVAIVLASFAVLAAWIGILQHDAATNESRTARQATRLASEAQTDAVVAQGAERTTEQLLAEAEALPFRRVFSEPPGNDDDLGLGLDPEAAEARLAESQAELEDIVEERGGELRFELLADAHATALTQAAVVEERITWNARASQYETVITVLGIAIFLVGFTLVLSRRIRPPILLPGIILAVYTFGWATHIYLRPIPRASETSEAVAATSEGNAHLDLGEVPEAIERFDAAVAANDDYRDGFEGRGLAGFLAANPDGLNTLAFTDVEGESLAQAVDDTQRALELGGDNSPTTLAVAGILNLAAGDFDRAADFLQDAVELNPLTPGVQLALSAIEVAQGDVAQGTEWRSRAVDLLAGQPTEGTRRQASIYYTLLEFAADQVPQEAPALQAIRDETVAAETELTADVELTGEAPEDAVLTVTQADFGDDELSVDLDVEGVNDDATVTIVGYERPTPDASWVQPTELFYAGPPPTGTGLAISTPRRCDPVEYRFDLYVEGRLVDTETSPGVEPTC